MTHFEKMKKRTQKLIVKWGSNETESQSCVENSFQAAYSSCPDASATWYAEFCISTQGE